MSIFKLVSVLVLSLGLSTFASAKEFRVALANSGANADGNYTSLIINKGLDGTTVYELVPATTEVEKVLKAGKCTDGARIEASVLSRTQEFDDENQRAGQETLKVLVRKVECS